MRKKCHDDPSLAVAHQCFWELHPAKAYAWELRLHDDQVALAREAVSATEIKYTVGRVPQSEVLAIIARNHGTLLAVREDQSAGKEWISFMYCVEK